MQVQAALTKAYGAEFSFENLEISEPKSGEILVKIISSGLCHTDEVAWKGFIPVPVPIVLGHEGAGIVEHSNASEFQKGDHVVFSFGYDGSCPNCKSGKPYACHNFNAINFGGVMKDGSRRLSYKGQEVSSFFGLSSFASHAVVDANSAIRVDKNLDLAKLSPLGCGVQTGAGAVLNRLKPGAGESIAVFGCGTVGLSAIMAAKLTPALHIIAVGGNEKSLELARELGATDVVNRHKTPDIAAQIKRLVKGGVNYAIDTSGAPEMLKAALASTCVLGSTVVLGVTGDVSFNIQAELMGESKSLIGIVEGDSNPQVFIPQLLEYYKKGLFPFDRLISSFAFKDLVSAFNKSSSVIKPVLMME